MQHSQWRIEPFGEFERFHCFDPIQKIGVGRRCRAGAGLEIAQEGIVEKRMATRDAAQMETFVTFAVYWKSVYGSRALRNAFSESESGQKYAFLKASDFQALPALDRGDELACLK